MPRLVMVSGWRGITREQEIRTELQALGKDDTVVHGGCRGADMIAEKVCKETGIRTIQMKPQGYLYKKGAPFKRNQQMVNMLPDLVLIFHPNNKITRGTADALKKAEKKKLTIKKVHVRQEYTEPYTADLEKKKKASAMRGVWAKFIKPTEETKADTEQV